jgi:hypothetical protein
VQLGKCLLVRVCEVEVIERKDCCWKTVWFQL